MILKFIFLSINIVSYIMVALPVIIIVSFIYISYYNIKNKLVNRIQYTREFSMQGIFENGELVITETIYNNNFLPIFFVDVESYIHKNLKLLEYTGVDNDSAMQLVISRFHLMPFMQIKRHHKIKCKHRGYYMMNTSCVITKSLGVQKTKWFEFNSELFVYPKILEIDEISYPVNLIYGESTSIRKVMQDPFSISGIREYSRGDSFNLINFKATAKSGFYGTQSIKVNKLDYCADRIFMIYVNFQTSPYITIPTQIYESLMEQALSFVSSFLSRALTSGYKVGFSANCHMPNGDKSIRFPVVNGAYYIEEILKEVAKIQVRCGMSFTSLLEYGAKAEMFNAEIFIITLYQDEAVYDSITALKKQNNVVNIIKLENEEYNNFLNSISKT